MEIYTDGSKIQSQVGAAAAVFKQGVLIHAMKSRLDNVCSNNQAEQNATLRALKNIDKLNIDPEERTVAVHTDSLITLTLPRNNCNH